ncbi:aldehyde dehydrogenase family protein, partial [Klebsiella pneumoniae]|uniref:aldehyde dehydrogenase family protein n=1 Tax=Klebsiella pneumoniae TaxID=573 RepID=UPI0015FAB47D
VRAISFTGGTVTGKKMLASAGGIKTYSMELGGKSPTVLLEDADFTAAMPLVLQAGFANSGQACIAGTRILVPRSRLAEFERVAKEAVSRIRSGDPQDAGT